VTDGPRLLRVVIAASEGPGSPGAVEDPARNLPSDASRVVKPVFHDENPRGREGPGDLKSIAEANQASYWGQPGVRSGAIFNLILAAAATTEEGPAGGKPDEGSVALRRSHRLASDMPPLGGRLRLIRLRRRLHPGRCVARELFHRCQRVSSCQ